VSEKHAETLKKVPTRGRPQGPLPPPVSVCPHLTKSPPLFADVLYGRPLSRWLKQRQSGKQQHMQTDIWMYAYCD